MSKTKDRNHNSKCCCSWDECGKWCQILRDSDEREYKDLGTISRVTLGQENLPHSYLKCASKHLQFDASKYKNNKYLYVAKHHFPHEYVRDKKSLKITKPITKEQANLHGITTFDDTNIAVKGTNTQPTTYFLAPVVTKSTVKRLIDNIMIGGGDRQKRACKRRREKDTVTITTTKPAAGDEACILPSITDPVTSITQYCPPVESLKDLIRRIVICETKKMESSDGYTLNKKLQENEHFRNISTLWKDFHKYTGHLELGSNQYIYMCKGNEKDCQKTIVYKTKCKANFTILCATCQKSRRNAKRRQDRMDKKKIPQIRE